jgi:CTP:molybdopterin cytidylyltransferase MocA
VVLAGGASQRMGRAKALIELDGRSFVARAVELLRGAGCAQVLVVDGAHRLADEQVEGATLVHNAGWERGPLSSLQLGLGEALAREPALDAIVVHHVERPRVRVETVRALLTAAAQEPDCIWQPTHDGRSGHPLIWPRACFDALLTLDPAVDTARRLARSHPRRKLGLGDPGVLDNVDTPADLDALRRRITGSN